MRLVSFNILHGRRAEDGGVVDLDALVRSVVALDPDLLALQEVDVGVPRSGRVDQAAVVAAALGFEVVFGKATRVGGIGKYGNALMTRRPIRHVEVSRLPRTGRRNEPRAAILATVDVGDITLSVCVAHLSIRRPEVHLQLEAALAALTSRPGPHVLIGDLNLGPDEVAPVVEQHGLVLAPSEQSTFPRNAPRARIDHVAVGGLTVGRVDVVATESSDHCALVVEVVVP